MTTSHPALASFLSAGVVGIALALAPTPAAATPGETGPAAAAPAAAPAADSDRAERRRSGSSSKSSSKGGKSGKGTSSKPAPSSGNQSSSAPPQGQRPTTGQPLAQPAQVPSRAGPQQPANLQRSDAPQRTLSPPTRSAPTEIRRTPQATNTGPQTSPSRTTPGNTTATSVSSPQRPAASRAASVAGRTSASQAAAAAKTRPSGQRASLRTPDTRVSSSRHARPGHQSASQPRHLRPHRSPDHRYARPHHHHLHRPAHVSHGPPRWGWYRPLYAHWWVHPYYRWTHATVAVAWFGFTVHAWTDTWVPPARAGWVWSPGYWSAGYWVPGYWVPGRTHIVYVNTPYAYVPGWWVGDVYVEGYYRAERRDQGEWTWVDGYYLDDGQYIWGHWVPATASPPGYVWAPGYWDGEQWVGGFWRPEHRDNYVWVGAFFDSDGIYHGGYWEPTQAVVGHVWIPGWFDGEQWIQGYWVSQAEFDSANVDDWEAPDGWNAGWDEEAAAIPGSFDEETMPLAMPVMMDEEQAGASEVHAPPPPGG